MAGFRPSHGTKLPADVTLEDVPPIGLTGHVHALSVLPAAFRTFWDGDGSA